MSNEKTKRRLMAIDYFIIFAVIATLVAAGLRVYEDGKPEENSVVVLNEEYILSYVSYGMQESAAKLLEKGEMFYMTGGQTDFGVLEENPVITPANVWVELENGELDPDVYAEKNGNNTKVDVTGTFRVKGCRNEDNLFYVEGILYIAPNMPITVYSNDMEFSFTVTGIEKVS